MLPFAGRVLALQGMHPTVSAGLEQHSSILTHPWERGWETIAYGLQSVFGDTLETARRTRELHRPIRGTDYDGNRYHAWNREAWTWVHLSTFDAVRYAAKALRWPLSLEDERELYQDWAASARLYGVQKRDIPADLAAYERYLADMIENRLVPTPTSKRLLDVLTNHLPAPPWLPTLPVVWCFVRHPAGRSVRTALVGSFPRLLRERHGLRWTVLDEAHYRAMVTALHVTDAVLPERLSHFPIAYAARQANRNAA